MKPENINGNNSKRLDRQQQRNISYRSSISNCVDSCSSKDVAIFKLSIEILVVMKVKVKVVMREIAELVRMLQHTTIYSGKKNNNEQQIIDKEKQLSAMTQWIDIFF